MSTMRRNHGTSWRVFSAGLKRGFEKVRAAYQDLLGRLIEARVHFRSACFCCCVFRASC